MNRLVKGVMSDKDWEDRLDRDEKVWAGRIRKVFRGYRKAILQRIKENPPTRIGAGYLEGIYSYEPLAEAYSDLIKAQGRKYYNFSKESIEEAVRKNTTIAEVLASRNDPYLRDILPYVDYVTANRVVTVVGTERAYAIDLIKESTEQALAEGLSASQTTALISRLVTRGFETTLSFRADRIARTEVAAFANYASFRGAMSTEVPFRKMWMATMDSRTRFDHIQIDSTTIEKEERFNVGGYPMMHPCDTSGPAEQVVNCRCRLGYVIDPAL